jgi:oligosaccharyltransferase complex subunit epsilon
MSLNVSKFLHTYNETPKILKICDTYLAFLVLTGVIQFIYCLLVGTFPFNSMLAGFIATVANFVLAGLLASGLD